METRKQFKQLIEHEGITFLVEMNINFQPLMSSGGFVPHMSSIKMREIDTEEDEEEEEPTELNDFIRFAHDHGNKVFYCQNSLCITPKCEKAIEVKDIVFGRVDYKEIENTDPPYGVELIPILFHPHILIFTDGNRLEVMEFEKTKMGCEK